MNIVRGGLLDYEVVAHYLESGHLGGLGLDVAWTKPFDPNNPILKFQIVLITPHVGGVTEHSYRSTAKVCIDAIGNRIFLEQYLSQWLFMTIPVKLSFAHN